MVVIAYLNGTPDAAGDHLSRFQREMVIITSSVVGVLSLYMILSQFALPPKRRPRRRSSSPSAHPTRIISIRTATLALASATLLHAILIITATALDVLNNPIVSAARTTCIGVTQSIAGLLAWERYQIVRPEVMHRPFSRFVVKLFLLFAFVLPFLVPWAFLALTGLQNAGHILSMDGMVDVLALLLIMLIVLGIPARMIFEASLGSLIICRISELRAALASSSSSSTSLPPLSSSSSTIPPTSAAALPTAKQKDPRQALLLLSHRILFYLFFSLSVNVINLIPITKKARGFVNTQLSLATQLVFCLLTYVCFDSDARFLTCVPFLPPFLRCCLGLPLQKRQGGGEEERREEQEGMRAEGMEEGGREGVQRRRHPMFDWVSDEREGGRRRWDDESEVKEAGMEGGVEERALSPRLVAAGSPLFRVSEERERDRVSGSLEIIQIMARREEGGGSRQTAGAAAAVAAAAAAGKDVVMEGASDRLVALPSPPLLRLPSGAWHGEEGGRGGGEMVGSEGSVEFGRMRRTLVASSQMQTPMTPSPTHFSREELGDGGSFKVAGEGRKEGGGEEEGNAEG